MAEPTAHSKFSASASERWLACPGSVVLSAGRPDSTSIHAARGTAAHSVLERCLLSNNPIADDALGETFNIDGHTFEFDQELADNVTWALSHIAEITSGCDIVQAETRVNYAHWIGVPEEEGFGTSDVIAVHSEQRELIVADYKNGRKAVDAVDNTQMMLYAGGALSQFDEVVDIDSVRMVILQPDAGRPKEHVVSVDELKAWLTGRARSGAASVQVAEQTYPDGASDWHDTFLKTGEHCQWCKAKATCPKIRGEVLSTVTAGNGPTSVEEFEAYTEDFMVEGKHVEADWLATCLKKVDLIEDWCKAIRAEAERRLLAGEPVPGFKIVAGKKGARSWADAKEAEKLLREVFRLPIEKAYDLKLISPTTAEKLHKAGDIGPRQWPKAQSLITQSEGKPHVAPDSDPRPSITVQPVDEMFESQAGDTV